ncbi:MAG: hypothetical protein IT349_12320 [Candidatus Eisenbacteria bacterium]|nr:hypothetical protein [Candidatus Eisenbacteria bacterium]MCC7142877.1 hypothetical protein [Candidatus Eisenbacteria bacterium]
MKRARERYRPAAAVVAVICGALALSAVSGDVAFAQASESAFLQPRAAIAGDAAILPGHQAALLSLGSALESSPTGESAGSAGPTGRNRHLPSIGLSLLLPGSAQLRRGDTGRGLLFLGAEAAIWSAFATYRFQGNARRDSYLEMARLFGHVPHPEGQDDDYYKLLGQISSSEIWDLVVRIDARRLYGDDLEARDAYLAANHIPAEQSWEWDSDAARARYREKRNDSQQAYRSSRNMIGLAVVNRLAAMFDAVLRDRVPDGSLRAQMTTDPDLGTPRLAVSLALP